MFAILARVLSILSIIAVGLTLWVLIRQVGREQRQRLFTPIIGLVLAPVTLLINILFLHQAFSAYLGPALLIFGLGFGLAWGQTTRLYEKNRKLVGKRSVLHLIFWGISYAITQILATFAPALWVAGGLAAMFFSTGATLGTNLNLLARLWRLRRLPLAVSSPTVLPERAAVSTPPPSLPEQARPTAPLSWVPERREQSIPTELPER
jgi:hypothetical protein